ncbi:hypothetical protein O1L44_27315 [Streptomyces noursei]|nr:hypothetical protein [Streptomyces noursei]
MLRAVLTGRDAAPTGLARTARDLLAELGADAPPGADEDELAEAVRTALAGRRTVLLLDDAPGAEHVEPLIPDAPDCLVVVVSQGPLTGIPDVRPCALGGLDTAAAVEVLCHYAGPTRVTVDPRTAEAVAEECGGQPAALILAGAWLAARPKLSVADLRQALLAVPLPPDLPAGDRPCTAPSASPTTRCPNPPPGYCAWPRSRRTAWWIRTPPPRWAAARSRPPPRCCTTSPRSAWCGRSPRTTARTSRPPTPRSVPATGSPAASCRSPGN